MSALVIDYKELATISSHANELAKKADAYADSLTRKITNKFDSVAGGVNGTLSSAKYYINAKINELQAKKTAYENFAKGVTSLITNAKRIDKEVANAISNNKDKFLKSNPHLKIDDWKANLINWLVDLKNSCPIFELIGDGLAYIGTSITSALDNIKYWYKCEGGKEVMGLIWAVGGAVVAVLLFVATIPASTFFAVCAAIAAAITMVNALANVATSYVAMIEAKIGDPAWAKIYSDRNTVQDIWRQTNFNNSLGNRLSYIGADIIDTVKLFCDVVNIVHAVGEIKSKLKFVQNYFDKNTGLLSYFKELKYTKEGIPKVDKHGFAETRFTFRSIWRGVKAFVSDSPIDCKSEMGIRTLLNQNFKIDFQDFRNSFSMKGIEDTIKYRISYGSKLNTILFSNNENLVKFAKDSWEIKDTANTINSLLNFGQNMEKIANGSFDIKKSVMEKIYNFNDVFSIANKLGVTKAVGDKFGWKTTEDGLAQKIAKSVTQSYPFVKAYGIVH